MCGICGYFCFDPGERAEEALVRRMCGTLRHRGPDDEGAYTQREVGLGIARLSIIDLEGGRQPIGNEDGSLWVVLNGEVYNYVELREELKARGHLFKTLSDTEVLLHLYEEKGEEMLHPLIGMFAFALWDGRKHTLFLARDRMGQKPLYWARTTGYFIFGSEPKALLRHPAISPELSLGALQKYLFYEFVPAPDCIFEGMQKLRPGWALRVSRRGVEAFCYWDVPPERWGEKLAERELLDSFRYILRDSVRKRLRSDVPFGVFLSGGIDSSTVAGMMTELIPGQVNSFSIGFREPSFDESSFARLASRHLGTEHREALLDEGHTLTLLRELSELLDEPLGDASLIPTYFLSKFTRKHVKVALGGDGGDELFAGYPTYQAHRLAGLYERLPAALRRHLLRPLIEKLPVSQDNISLDFKLKRFISGEAYTPPLRNYVWLGSFPPEELGKALSADSREALDLKGHPVWEDIDFYASRSRARDPISLIQYLDMKLYLQDDILVKVDRASMFTSLEVRAPFLDHRIVEFVAALPSAWKLRRLTTKYLLKRAVADTLPKSIIHRKKKGFGIPAAQWFTTGLRETLLSYLSPERLRKQGLFEPDYVQGLVQDHFSRRRDNRKQLWTLLIFQVWHDRWLKGVSL